MNYKFNIDINLDGIIFLIVLGTVVFYGVKWVHEERMYKLEHPTHEVAK